MRKVIAALLLCSFVLSGMCMSVWADMQTVFNSNNDFPKGVGESGFLYESSENGSTFTNMHFDSGTWFVQAGNWNTSWAQNAKINLKTGPWVSITFIAPYSGALKVSDNANLWTGQPLSYKTMHNEAVLTKKEITNTGDNFNVTDETLQVTEGDKVRVMLKNNGDSSTDVWYQVKITYTSIDTTLQFDEDTFAVKEGQTKKLPFTATTIEGATNEAPEDVVWVSDDSAVATVASGLVTGVAVGSTEITALSQSGKVLDTITVIVQPPPSDVEFTAPPELVLNGNHLSATVVLEKNEDTLGEDSAQITMILVLQDENGYVDDYKAVTKTVTKGEAAVSLKIEDMEIPSGYVGSAQILLWDSLDGMKPMYQRTLEGLSITQ